MYVMVLNDGETYSEVKGCKILELPEDSLLFDNDEEMMVKYWNDPDFLENLLTEYGEPVCRTRFPKAIATF